MKYFVRIIPGTSFDKYHDAGSKAPKDVERTLLESGRAPIEIAWRYEKWWFRHAQKSLTHLKMIFQSRRAFRHLTPNDEVVMQFPSVDHQDQPVIREIKRRGASVVILIHDLDFLRHKSNPKMRRLEQKDVATLKMADTILVHTERMAEALRSKGVGGEMRVLNLFDYYSESTIIESEELERQRTTIAFAGQLAKSGFLRQIHPDVQLSGLQLNLYGPGWSESIVQGSNIHYKGSFKPNDPSILAAGWGLVWDGDSADTCKGDLGDYLRINVSHKLSLYLSCGMPVIVWRESGVAQWVTEQGVGIAIDSIGNIVDALQRISAEEYRDIVARCQTMAKTLRTGGMLRKVLL